MIQLLQYASTEVFYKLPEYEVMESSFVENIFKTTFLKEKILLS
jgi:hypothetical protein